MIFRRHSVRALIFHKELLHIVIGRKYKLGACIVHHIGAPLVARLRRAEHGRVCRKFDDVAVTLVTRHDRRFRERGDPLVVLILRKSFRRNAAVRRILAHENLVVFLLVVVETEIGIIHRMFFEKSGIANVIVLIDYAVFADRFDLAIGICRFQIPFRGGFRKSPRQSGTARRRLFAVG